MRSIRWVLVTLAIGVGLGVVTILVDSVPLMLGEVGLARVDRSGWSQTAEFASLILDSGWAWAAAAVAVGWVVSRERPALIGACAGCVALIAATIAFYGVRLLFADDGSWWELVPRYWLTLSLLLGMPLGAIGATIRRPGLVGAFAAVVAPIGAVVNLLLWPLPQESPVAGLVQATVWGGAVAFIAMVVARAVSTRRRGARAA